MQNGTSGSRYQSLGFSGLRVWVYLNPKSIKQTTDQSPKIQAIKAVILHAFRVQVRFMTNIEQKAAWGLRVQGLNFAIFNCLCFWQGQYEL